MIAIMSTMLDGLGGIEKRYGRGRFLFHQGDLISTMFLVIEGEARLERVQASGSVSILQRTRAGSVLAEASLFAHRYHCAAVAASAVTARLIPRIVMRKRFDTDPAFAAEWAMHLADEIRRARMRSEILSLKRVQDRVDAWIALNGEGCSKGSLRGMAQEIGVSPEALYREIAKRRSPA